MGRDTVCTAYSPYKSLQTLPGCHDSMYDAKEYQHCKTVDPKLTEGGRANANPGVECIHCQSEFTGGPFHIRGHILSIRNRGGGACTADDTAAQDAKAYFQQVEDDMAANKQKKRKREELDELTNGSGTGGSTNGLVQLTMEEAIAPCLRDKADQSVARFLIAEGVPFVKIESVYFQDMLTAVGGSRLWLQTSKHIGLQLAKCVCFCQYEPLKLHSSVQCVC